jgi:hypothetical protein
LSFVWRLSSLRGPKCIGTIERKYLGLPAVSFIERLSLFRSVHYQRLHCIPLLLNGILWSWLCLGFEQQLEYCTHSYSRQCSVDTCIYCYHYLMYMHYNPTKPSCLMYVCSLYTSHVCMLIEWIQILVCFSTSWDHYFLLPILSGITTSCCLYCLGSLLPVASTACCPILHFIEYHSISNYCTVHTYFLRPRLHDAVFPEMVTWLENNLVQIFVSEQLRVALIARWQSKGHADLDKNTGPIEPLQ